MESRQEKLIRFIYAVMEKHATVGDIEKIMYDMRERDADDMYRIPPGIFKYVEDIAERLLEGTEVVDETIK